MNRINTGIGTLPLSPKRFLKQHWLFILCCVYAVGLGVAAVFIPDFLCLLIVFGLLILIGCDAPAR